ncbi:aspartoacylase [Aphanothece sacrum]|uniref:Probable aspartoacylase n=1 Tax=Aphanothece sacrum FPU1 TaxID=1920663 RepID=A0A401IFC3_APHSA|nr:aspartoacylase [Aphanothece sacrum]GBF79997.1 aspartoacylase [Aphanothece sacrum FPU1]GBF83783.1 aspartoacylase [Aphanothece sacrum FPU3]
MSKQQIKKVAIVGGTHGNELTGIYLIKKFTKIPNFIQRSNFDTLTLLGNLKAIKLVTRYVDIDLNRCFRSQDLQNPNLNNYEQIRAKEIAQKIHQEQVDFIIDLHSTTSDMGLTIILNSNHPFLLKLATHLTLINPLVKVLQYAAIPQNPPYLRNLCPLGLAIEVGAIPQGVLKAELFHQTEILISNILDYIELYNRQKIPNTPNNCTVYRQIGIMDYPRDNYEEIQAMIAPEVIDYEPLHPGSPMFLHFDGKISVYEGDSIIYPVFIGEAAYIEKKIAMSLTLKHQVNY